MTGWPLLILALPVSIPAQSLRVSGSTNVRYIELRPFARDSVAQSSAPGTSLLRQLPDGRVVRCVPGEAYCRDVRPAEKLSTIPVIQDVEASAWGIGRGVQLYTQLRGRSAGGKASDLWPRADDAFDVLAAYAELERDRYRVRAGRQWTVSGLGFYNFDGVNASLAARRLAVDVYAGRSLARGVNESVAAFAAESIEGIGALQPGFLIGTQLRYRRGERLALGALYHLDVASDRRALYSELAAVDATLTHPRVSLEGVMEADVASGSLNEARFTARTAAWRRASVLAELRRYRPYFELWTIWGAFSPFAFDEARSGATWSDSSGRLTVRGEVAYRSYRDDDMVRGPSDLRSSGWSAGSSVAWSPFRDWQMSSAYQVDAGFGAARENLTVGLTRFLGDAALSAQVLYFQRLYEFRLEEGAALGVVADAVIPVDERLQAAVSVALYHHDARGVVSRIDWNQRRASVRLQWTVGAEPRASVPLSGAPQ